MWGLHWRWTTPSNPAQQENLQLRCPRRDRQTILPIMFIMGELLQQLLILLGGIICLVYLVKSTCFLKYIFPRIWSRMSPSFFQSMGEWAVITGAGDGIGKAYSFELARHGLNVVLISRTLEKLQKVASEIEQTTDRKVKIIQADFTKTDIYSNIKEQLQGLEIGILVNNVGVLPSVSPTCYLNGPENDEDLIHCNILSLVKMTQIVLKQMVLRKKGIILNLSSVLGTFPCPLYSSYSASKHFKLNIKKRKLSFRESQSQLLAVVEAQPYSVRSNGGGRHVEAVTPFGVSTPMTLYANPSFFTKRPEDFVRESLDYVTFGDVTYGCLAHEIMGCFMRCIPWWVLHSNRVQEIIQLKMSSYLKKKQKSM